LLTQKRSPGLKKKCIGVFTQKKKVQKRKYLSLFFLRVSGVGNKRKPEKRDSITFRQKKKTRARACIITRKRRSFHEDRGDSSRSSGG